MVAANPISEMINCILSLTPIRNPEIALQKLIHAGLKIARAIDRARNFELFLAVERYF